MRCIRCRGLMVGERVFTREGGIPMVRCLHCGELVDLVVMLNRGRYDARFKKLRSDNR
ncbi:MAG TPA: hypothetical protein VFG95_04380 [Nitrospiria bacterium]|nr:hypothetical protein [Nitrospiria bacterium]